MTLLSIEAINVLNEYKKSNKIQEGGYRIFFVNKYNQGKLQTIHLNKNGNITKSFDEETVELSNAIQGGGANFMPIINRHGSLGFIQPAIPLYYNPHFSNPHFSNPHFSNPHFSNPHFLNPHFSNPHFSNPHFSNPEIYRSKYLGFDLYGNINWKKKLTKCITDIFIRDEVSLLRLSYKSQKQINSITITTVIENPTFSAKDQFIVKDDNKGNIIINVKEADYLEELKNKKETVYKISGISISYFFPYLFSPSLKMIHPFDDIFENYYKDKNIS